MLNKLSIFKTIFLGLLLFFNVYCFANNNYEVGSWMIVTEPYSTTKPNFKGMKLCQIQDLKRRPYSENDHENSQLELKLSCYKSDKYSCNLENEYLYLVPGSFDEEFYTDLLRSPLESQIYQGVNNEGSPFTLSSEDLFVRHIPSGWTYESRPFKVKSFLTGISKFDSAISHLFIKDEENCWRHYFKVNSVTNNSEVFFDKLTTTLPKNGPTMNQEVAVRTDLRSEQMSSHKIVAYAYNPLRAQENNSEGDGLYLLDNGAARHFRDIFWKNIEARSSINIFGLRLGENIFDIINRRFLMVDKILGKVDTCYKNVSECEIDNTTGVFFSSNNNMWNLYTTYSGPFYENIEKSHVLNVRIGDNVQNGKVTVNYLQSLINEEDHSIIFLNDRIARDELQKFKDEGFLLKELDYNYSTFAYTKSNQLFFLFSCNNSNDYAEPGTYGTSICAIDVTSK